MICLNAWASQQLSAYKYETALERQDLSRRYLAHHELESEFIVIKHEQQGKRG